MAAFLAWKDDKGNPMDKDSVAQDKIFYADWIDDIAPELDFTSTNNVAETQTVTMNMSDKGSGDVYKRQGYEVVAINDLTSPKMLAHLLKYDSSQGKYEHADEVSYTDDSIIVCGKEIKIYAFPDANNCPWGELKVDVVLELSLIHILPKPE